MFGCFGRLGCLVLVLALAAAAWFTRDMWMERVGLVPDNGAVVSDLEYKPISEAEAESGREKVESLSARRGYVTLTGSEAASWLVSRFVERIPPGSERVEAAVVGNSLELRAVVPLGDLGSIEQLGPLAGLVGGREEIRVAGTLEMVEPGLAQYRVRRMQVGNLSVPSAVVPVLLREIWRGDRPDGLDTRGVAVRLPDDVGQVRVEDGSVIIYRTVQ